MLKTVAEKILALYYLNSSQGFFPAASLPVSVGFFPDFYAPENKFPNSGHASKTKFLLII